MRPRFQPASPRETALRILKAWLGPGVERVTPDPALGLTAFQETAMRRVSAALQRRRGALLADAVGLGKTYVALAVIAAALDAGERVLVSAPAALRNHWQRHLARLQRAGTMFLSHTALSNGRRPPSPPDLIVIDEAHAFRNPHTRRYRNLLRLTQHARVLLLSATPVNNTPEDLYQLIRLFARDDDFHDLGIGDLRTAFRRNGGAAPELDRVLHEVLVRRERSQVNSKVGLGFPRRAAPVSIHYDLTHTASDWARLCRALESLEFAPYSGESAAPAELMRLQLLKRLESSTAAFQASILSLRRFTELFIEAASSGTTFSARHARTLHRSDEWLQLALPIDVHDIDDAGDRDRRVEQARCDVHLLRTCAQLLSRDAPDLKLGQLQQIITARPNEKILVFTQFSDTARYLWHHLHTKTCVGLVTGQEARLGASRASRTAVIECFAPRANHARRIDPRSAVAVLIATDVLSEGLNLQDASTVVNYDISWNPVTLIQRIGRIDRLGSAHEQIAVLNFIPDRGLDLLLRLMERVEQKLATIDRLVGTDAPVLDVPAVGSARRALDFCVGRSHHPGPSHNSKLDDLRSIANREAASESKRPVAAVMCGEHDLTLAAVESGKAVRILIIADGSVTEDRSMAVDVLRRALANDAKIVGAEIDVTPALDWLETDRAVTWLAAPPQTQTQRKATRRLLELLATAGTDPQIASRGQQLLAQLAEPVSMEAETQIALWAERPFNGEIDHWLRELQSALGPAARPGRTRARVFAALRVCSNGQLGARRAAPA